MLVGLCGGIAAGKDTTYERTLELYGREYCVDRLGYADKMKDSVAALFGITKSFIELEKRNPQTVVVLSSPVADGHGNVGSEEIVLTFREFLQRYGTEAHRDIFNDLFWVNSTLPMDFDHSGKIVMITDARFESELQRIVDLGGVNIYIKNDSSATLSEAQHSSETSINMDLVSYTIDNRVRNDEFKNLDNQITAILDEILETNLLEA